MPSTPRSIGVQQQFNKIPVLGLVAEQKTSAPASPALGQMYYDTIDNRLKVWENGAWANASATGMLTTGTSFDGDVSGVYNNLQIKVGAVGLNEIAAGVIDDSKIAAGNKDGNAATYSMRTLGTGTQQAMAGSTRLDQIPAPTAAVSLNGQEITNLPTTPTFASSATSKAYVDSVVSGLDIHPSVRVASTANVAGTYNATGGTNSRGSFTLMPSVIDGVTLVNGDRVLLKNQTTGAQNGIYVVTTVGTGANGVWERAADADSNAEVSSGAFVFVEEGTANDNSGWVLATNNPITLGGASGTALTFTQFSSSASLTAGAGLSQTGGTFDVNVDGSSIEINADILRIKALGVTNAMLAGGIDLTTKVTGALPIANGGTGATTAAAARVALAGATGTTITTHGALVAGTELLLTHGLGTKNVIVAIFRAADDYEEELAVRAASTTQIGVTADIAYAADSLRFVIVALGV